MIGTSFGAWIFIRLCILFLSYTPLIYASILATLLLKNKYTAAASTALPWTFATLLVAEGLFFIFIYRPYLARLKAEAQHPEPLSSKERRELFDRCLVNVPDPEKYLQWWFLGADVDEIKRDNVREFFLWAFFERGMDDSTDDDEAVDEEVNEYISTFEDVLDRKFKPGRGTAQSLRLTLDNIPTTYRSLTWYMTVFIVDQATHTVLKLYGFHYYRRPRTSTLRIFPPRPQEVISRHASPVPQLSYWHREHTATNALPVVFFHGIGIGLWPYMRFLAEIHKRSAKGDGQIGVIAVEILPISFRLYSQMPTRSEFLEQITTILDHHHWKDVTLVSHSYGSVLVTHMLHSPTLQHRVKSIVLIDPVTIMLHLPNVAYNFTRRLPRRANEWQLWYFASTDPGVALSLGRHFFWRQNIIWKDELLSLEHAGTKTHRKVVVCLSGLDLIVDTAAVAEYLGVDETDADEVRDSRMGKVHVVQFPKLDHAQVFDDPTEWKRVAELVKSVCQP